MSLLLSLQEPKSLSDPNLLSLENTHTHTYTHAQTSAVSGNTQQQSLRHAAKGQENFCCLV